jgi:hypothetical protein
MLTRLASSNREFLNSWFGSERHIREKDVWF